VSDLLLAFSLSLVNRLQADGLLSVKPGASERVVQFLADRLADQPELSSLVSASGKALVDCPDVEELFADDEELKEAINDLGL
jgi:hypothetical protein